MFAALTGSVLALALVADEAAAQGVGDPVPADAPVQDRVDPASPGKGEATPFKVAKIYFETNASACDMGIQIVFDTEGIAKASFKDPNNRVIHLVTARNGLLGIGGQTEGFLESVEPVVAELVDANPDCEPDPEEPTISLDRIRRLFPAGSYDFQGVAPDGKVYGGEADLTYAVPAGPVLGSPDGKVGLDANAPVTINWKQVTTSIPGLLPEAEVDVVAYQVLVYDGDAGESPPEFNVTVPATETSVTVPTQFLEPAKNYEIEVLAIEAGGNQTISEGAFTTR